MSNHSPAPVATGSLKQGANPANVAVSTVLLLAGIGFTLASRGEGVGSWHQPGPGFFPMIVGVVLSAAALFSLVDDLRAREVRLDEDDEEFTGDVRWVRVLAVVAIAVVVALLAPTVGFVTGISIGLVAMAKVAGVEGWLRPALLGIGFGVVAWLVFVYWLMVPLPIGVLGTV